MATRRLRLHVRIPPYHGPRNTWGRALHEAIVDQQQRRSVTYKPTARLEVHVHLYLDRAALGLRDVDNRLQDIVDALQGRAGGPKAVRSLAPVVPNDRQIYRVIIEKAHPPKQSRGFGHLCVRKLQVRRRTPRL